MIKIILCCICVVLIMKTCDLEERVYKLENNKIEESNPYGHDTTIISIKELK
jgi:hypothetical protein